MYHNEALKNNTFEISIPENILGLFAYFLGINILISHILPNMSYAVLFIAGFSLIIGLLFLVDYFLYKSLSSVIPGFILSIFCLILVLDFFITFPVSYSSLILISGLIGGSVAFGILFIETQRKAYKATSWILFILFVFQLVSKSYFVKENLWKFWPVILIISGILLFSNIHKKRNKIL